MSSVLTAGCLLLELPVLPTCRLIVGSVSPHSTFLSGLLHISFSSAGSNGEDTLKANLQRGGKLKNQDLSCAVGAEWERPTQGRGPPANPHYSGQMQLSGKLASTIYVYLLSSPSFILHVDNFPCVVSVFKL